MRFFIPSVAFVLFATAFGYSLWSSAAVALWVLYVCNLAANLNKGIAFREYILVMYGLNYLFSPALQYHLPTQDYSIYRMRISEAEYFSLAIPAILSLQLGLYAIKNKILTVSFSLTPYQSYLNESMLKKWLIAGVIFNFAQYYFPGDLAFVAYLLAGLRYIAVFGLFIIDRRKYKWYLLIVLFLEIAHALREGMFHDMVLWILFFGMIWTYLKKPSQAAKLGLGVIVIVCLNILQVSKEGYRAQLSVGNSGFSTFSSSVAKNTEGEGFFSITNFGNSIIRANQGWIFSSTIKNINTTQNFQQLALVKKYAEAAFMPRFLAPDKIKAGDKEIFNQYSGAKIGGNTSMGLGILADGYIAYGTLGVMIFAFVLGLMCASIFKIVQGWCKLTPFFVLFIFLILNYAVRADCETQTILTHIVKGLIVFGLLVGSYKRYFHRQASFAKDEVGDVSENNLVLSPN